MSDRPIRVVIFGHAGTELFRREVDRRERNRIVDQIGSGKGFVRHDYPDGSYRLVPANAVAWVDVDGDNDCAEGDQ